jgi:hypothetical protein
MNDNTHAHETSRIWFLALAGVSAFSMLLIARELPAIRRYLQITRM